MKRSYSSVKVLVYHKSCQQLIIEGIPVDKWTRSRHCQPSKIQCPRQHFEFRWATPLFSKNQGIPVDMWTIQRRCQPSKIQCRHYHYEFRGLQKFHNKVKDEQHLIKYSNKMGCLSNIKFSEFSPILSKKRNS